MNGAAKRGNLNKRIKTPGRRNVGRGMAGFFEGLNREELRERIWEGKRTKEKSDGSAGDAGENANAIRTSRRRRECS